MTEVTWNRVGRALLGRWPSQVTAWGEEGMAAFIEELQADGLTPEAALTGIRMHRPAADKDFPPSVAAVSDNARRDPGQPTFEEVMGQLYEPGGVFGFRRSGVTVSPWVLAFVRDAGRDWLRDLPVLDPAEGKWARRDIKEAWDRFVLANEGRAVAEIAARSGRGSLGRLDPMSVLDGKSERPAITTGGER